MRTSLTAGSLAHLRRRPVRYVRSMTAPGGDWAPERRRVVAQQRHVRGGIRRRHLPVQPQRRLAVVACMDSRMDIFEMLGLRHGEAHIIRNAGGVITDDVTRSLCVSQRYLGTREIVLLHHTDCGLQQVDEDDFKHAARGRGRRQAGVGTGVVQRPVPRHPAVDPQDPDVTVRAPQGRRAWLRLRRRHRPAARGATVTGAA